MKTLDKKEFHMIRNWMQRNARPLEMARFRYHFEGGDMQEVLTSLAAFQNEDGGFGKALEADSWNPNSAPYQTWIAIEILNEIEHTDEQHPIVQGILRYLQSGKDMEGERWPFTIPSNDQYPHAPWWGYTSDPAYNTYHPSAGFAGFLFLFAQKESALYEQAKRVAAAAAQYLQTTIPDMNEMAAFLPLPQCARKAGIYDVFDVDEMENMLKTLIHNNLEKDRGKWESGYVDIPIHYFYSPQSPYYEGNEELAQMQVAHLLNTRNEEGVWDITWSWGAYEREFALSTNWWKASFVLRDLLYLRNFGAFCL